MAIQAFAFEPLLTMLTLHFARRNVVDNRIAKYMLECVGFTDIDARCANDYCKLDFPIEFLGDAAMSGHVRKRPIYCCRRFREKCGMRGHLLHMRARFRAFGEVLDVIPADT